MATWLKVQSCRESKRFRDYLECGTQNDSEASALANSLRQEPEKKETGGVVISALRNLHSYPIPKATNTD